MLSDATLIRKFIPDLATMILEEKIEDCHFYKVTRQGNPQHFHVCLLKVTDYVPEPFQGSNIIEVIEDRFGLDVLGCFFVRSGRILARDDRRLRDQWLPERLSGDAVFYDNDIPYYLYLLKEPPTES